MAWLRAPIWQRWVVAIYFAIGLTWGVWLDLRRPSRAHAPEGWGSRVLNVSVMTLCWPFFAATWPFLPPGD